RSLQHRCGACIRLTRDNTMVFLHYWRTALVLAFVISFCGQAQSADDHREQDRKSTRLNSSHVKISYAVFCLKKKMSLLAILIILCFQFRTVTASLIHFSGVFVALAGVLLVLWVYGQPWLMDFPVGGTTMRDL